MQRGTDPMTPDPSTSESATEARLREIAEAKRNVSECPTPGNCMYPQHHADDESHAEFADRLQRMASAALASPRQGSHQSDGEPSPEGSRQEVPSTSQPSDEMDTRRAMAEAIRQWYATVGRNPVTGSYDQPQPAWLLNRLATSGYRLVSSQAQEANDHE